MVTARCLRACWRSMQTQRPMETQLTLSTQFSFAVARNGFAEPAIQVAEGH